MTAPARSRRRLRFSLRSLVLLTLLIASAGSLWGRWEPWIVERSLSANGRYTDRVLFLPGNLFATHAPGCIRIWKANTFELLHDIKMEDDRASSLWIPPGTDLLMTLSTGGAIDEWDPRTGRHLRRVVERCVLSDESSITAPTWSTDGRRAFDYLPDFSKGGIITLRVTDYESGDTLYLATFPKHGAGLVLTCDLSPDGKYLALLLDHSKVSVPPKYDVALVLWDLDARKQAWKKDLIQTKETSLQFAEDSMTICLYAYPPETGSKTFFGLPDGDGVPFNPPPLETDFTFSPDGKYFVNPGTNELRRPGATHYSPSRSPQIENTETGERAAYLARTVQEIHDYAFAPDGRLAVAKADGTIDIWRYSRPEAWWGVVCVPGFWLTVICLALLAWSLRKDRRDLA